VIDSRTPLEHTQPPVPTEVRHPSAAEEEYDRLSTVNLSCSGRSLARRLRSLYRL